MLKGLRLILGFLTRIPVNIDWEVQDGELEKGIVWFPVVGLILGVCCAAGYQLAVQVLPVSISILIGMTILIFLTGAFHIDGFADTADAIYSARTRERMLEIMKDSRVGTNGAIAIVLDLAFRYIGLWNLSEMFHMEMWKVFLLLPVAGKMVQGLVGYKGVYAREKGLGLFIGTLTLPRTILCGFLGILAFFVGFGGKGALCAVCVMGLVFLFRKYIEGILGGLTGDIMGAANEIAEIVLLIFLQIFY